MKAWLAAPWPIFAAPAFAAKLATRDVLAARVAALTRPLVFTNGVFGLFTIWLPEMFPSALRGAGSGFAFSLGRVLGAAGPTLIGTLAATTGSFPLAISLLSLIYVIGLPFIALAPETANRPLAK